MNIGSVLKTIGTGLLATNPAGLAIMTAIDAFLPEEAKLTPESTGEEAVAKIDTYLNADQKSQLLLANVNLQVEEEKGRTARYIAMAQADGQETRAKIVNRAMTALIFLAMIFVLATAYVYVIEGAAVAFSTDMAIVFVTVSGTFAYVIRAYFGDLKSETTSRHQAIDDKPQQPKGLFGILSALRK